MQEKFIFLGESHIFGYLFLVTMIYFLHFFIKMSSRNNFLI